MQYETADVAKEIEALSTAGEFLLCAIRALAVGNPLEDPNVQNPIAWAKEKIAEIEQGRTS